MSLEDDLCEARSREMRMYLESMNTMYCDTLRKNKQVYDVASRLTKEFTAITAEAILEDSRIIRVLRYAMAPSISQMKFGQVFGINSISKFEKDRLRPGTAKYRLLEGLAAQIAHFAAENLDQARFVWLVDRLSAIERDLARKYAKKWTCSIVSDQNAQTQYRNWRKNRQELAVASCVERHGYGQSDFKGVICSKTDIAVGEFTKEVRVKGRTRQKADLVVRSRRSRKLVLIEAKAVGVEIDSTKRIKECCDKANDWRSSNDLDDPVVITVIAGFFNVTGIENLQASGITVVWDHRLDDLTTAI